MKIDDSYKNMTLISNSKEASANNKTEEQIAQTQGPEKRRESSAEVDFSKTSVEFSRAAEAVEKDAMERAERVNRIKAQVAEGTYKVDSPKIADKILRNAISTLTEP